VWGRSKVDASGEVAGPSKADPCRMDFKIRVEVNVPPPTNRL